MHGGTREPTSNSLATRHTTCGGSTNGSGMELRGFYSQRLSLSRYAEPSVWDWIGSRDRRLVLKKFAHRYVFIMASGSCNGYKIIIFFRLENLATVERAQWSCKHSSNNFSMRLVHPTFSVHGRVLRCIKRVIDLTRPFSNLKDRFGSSSSAKQRPRLD